MVSWRRAADTDNEPPRGQRTWRGISLLALLIGGAALAGILVRGGEAGELNHAQWERLLQRMSRRAVSPATSAPVVSARAASEAAPLPPVMGEGDGDAALTQSSNGDAAAWRLPPAALSSRIAEHQAADYAAERDKSVIELQPFRTTTTIDINDGGQRRGTATLINLNPRINAWHLLRIEWRGEPQAHTYHLTNATPKHQSLVLRRDFPFGINLAGTQGELPCDLWSHDNPRRLEEAAARNTPYVMLCDERVTLRLKTTGHRTTVEKVTDFLRDNVWGGEAITVFVREQFYQDAFLSTAELAGAANGNGAGPQIDNAPRPARLAPQASGRLLTGTDLGLSLDEVPRGGPAVGAWYRLRANPGVFASAMQPNLVANDILAGHPRVVAPLDEVEAEALAYLAAFDLDAFDIAFSLGTDHPRVGWSERVAVEHRDVELSGPDGITSSAPLVTTGTIPGSLAGRAVAAFTGGFKRSHGGFKFGELAMLNNGSHYGFIEEGVVLSKLQPGLATLYVLEDGTLGMKTWTAEDDALLEGIRYARQNGVPIIEHAGGDTDPGVPGDMVNRWGPGNWSGSQDGKYRTLRAGACLQHTDSRAFLLYAYFSSATPSAMARVFQAYGCSYAMLLDMNALEHTYLAVYALRGNELAVEHLVRGMEVLDKNEDGRLLPRFLGYADNRDFFYVLRRAPMPPTAPGEPR